MLKISPGWTDDEAIEVEILGKVDVEYFIVNPHALVTNPEQSWPPAQDKGAEGKPVQPPPPDEQTWPADLQPLIAVLYSVCVDHPPQQ